MLCNSIKPLSLTEHHHITNKINRNSHKSNFLLALSLFICTSGLKIIAVIIMTNNLRIDLLNCKNVHSHQVILQLDTVAILHLTEN